MPSIYIFPNRGLDVSPERSDSPVYGIFENMREFIVYQDDGGRWIAECEDIPGYRAKGKTKEEVLAKIESALLTFYPCKCEN